MLTLNSIEKPRKIASHNGADIYLIETDKFKTNTINIFFHDTLNRKNATQNALIPAVLRRGSKNLATMREMSLYLEELYGAGFDCGVLKKGEEQIVQFYMDFIPEKYLKISDSQFVKIIDVIFDIMFIPALENGAFNREYTEQEKINLKNIIESRANDKVQYATDRCTELMCKDEPYSIYEYGFVDDLAKISHENLYKHYTNFIRDLPISIFITGVPDDDKTQYLVEKINAVERSSVKPVKKCDVKKAVTEVRNITEEMDLNQGKLTLGFRTNVGAAEKGYYPLLVFNGILGGGVHSKLFKNVREASGLAYYASSSLDKYKGLMTVSSGIAQENREKAVEIILKQISDMKAGDFTEYEFNSTVKAYETGLKSLRDSQINLVDFYLGQMVAGTNDTMDDLIEKIKAVDRQQVVEIADSIQLDLIYFLKGFSDKATIGGKE